MSGDLQSHYGKAQRETAQLLGYDLACLAPDQSLRLDCAVALRLALDDLQGRIVRGESIDVNRMLTAAEALGRILPPAVLASPPPADCPDPRQIMLDTYMGMRKRGELFDPTSTFEGRGRRIAELEAEIERLKAGTTAPDEVNSPRGEIPPAPAAPAPGNVVKLRHATSPQPPRPAPPQPPAAPAYDYNANQDWKTYVNPDGSIRSTPRGRWDT